MSNDIDLKLEIAADAADEPIVVAVMANRGFGSPSKPSKAEPVSLHARMTVANGFETIVSACLRHFRLNERLVVQKRHAEALHQARVAMRRLRSAFSLFRPVVADQEFARIREELRWFTAELGDARNLDVYLQRDLTRDQRQFVEERREKAYDNAIAAMGSARFRRLMSDLPAWTAGGEWCGSPRAAKPLQPFMERRIDRLWRKISKSDPASDVNDRRRHRLRIRMKKLRYSLEFFDTLHSRRKKSVRLVKDLQRSLGKLHDIVTARALVTINPWLRTPGPSAKDERRLVRAADRGIRRLSRLRPYWRAA